MSVHGARRVSALEANGALANGSSKTDGAASPATPTEPRSPVSAPGSSASASSAQVSPLLDLSSIARSSVPGLSRRDLSDAFSEADQPGAAAAATASPSLQQRGAAADTDEARSSGVSPHAQAADPDDDEADAAAAPTVDRSAASAAAVRDIYDHLARPDRLRVGDFVVTLEPMSLLARVTAIEENGLWVRTFQVSVPHFYFSHQLRSLIPIANDEQARLTAGVVHALWRSDSKLSWSSYLPVAWDEPHAGDRFRNAMDGSWEANLGDELMTDAPQSLQLPMSKNHWEFPPFCSLQRIDAAIRQAAQSAPRGHTGRVKYSVRRLAATAEAIDESEIAVAGASQWSHLGRCGHIVMGSLVLNQEAAACEVMEIKEDGMLLWPLMSKEGGQFVDRPPAAFCPFASISLILPVLEEQLLAKPALLGVFTLYSHDGDKDSNAWNGAYYPASYSCMKQKKNKADQEGGVESDKKEFNITYAHEQCVKTAIALEPQQLREDNHARVVPAFCFTRPFLRSDLDAPPAAAAAASSSLSIWRPASVAHGAAEPNRNQSAARALASQAPSGAGAAAAAGGLHERAASPQNAAARVEAAPIAAAAIPPPAAALAASAAEPMDIDAGDDDDWSGSAEGEQEQPDGAAATAVRTAAVTSPATLSQRPDVTPAATVPTRVGGTAAGGPARSPSPVSSANNLQPAHAADMDHRGASAAAAAVGLGVVVAELGHSSMSAAASPSSSSLSDLLSLQAASVRALELRLDAALKQVEEHGQEKSSWQRQMAAQTSLATQKTAEADRMRAEHTESLAKQQRETDDLRRQLAEERSHHTAELQARDAQLAAREAQLIELEQKQTYLHADVANAKARVLRLQSRSTEDSIRLRELEEQAADAAAASRRVAELHSKRRAETELQEETKRQRGAGAGNAE